MHMSATSMASPRCATSLRSENSAVSPRWYTTLSPTPISRPAGVFTCPFGVVEVCQAGTSLTQPQSNFTVPPRLGSDTFSTPSSVSSLAISTIATTCALVRWAMSTVSPMWSACPWVRRMCVGSTSEASTAALGLPVRNGSISTRVWPSVISKHACPRKRISTSVSCLVVWFHLEYPGELPSNSHPHQHPHAGLLGEQRLDLCRSRGVVRPGGGLAHLALVRLAEPTALAEGLGQNPLELGGDARPPHLGLAEALRLGEGLHGGVHLLVGEPGLRHAGG